MSTFREALLHLALTAEDHVDEYEGREYATPALTEHNDWEEGHK